MTPQDKPYWWEKAKEASRQTGWFATVILAQWQLETGNWTSRNFRENNNIAGQTWTPQYPESMKGSARPPKEDGYYVRYDDPVVGYVDFIRRNPRYANVKLQKTEEGQIHEIARQGWAADTRYEEVLLEVLKANKNQGYTMEEAEEPMLDKGVANTIIHTWMGPSWKEADQKRQEAVQAGDSATAEVQQKQADYIHWLANELRKASGQPEE